MAYRLGDYVVYGELYNTRNYRVHGWIALRGELPGREFVLHLELTGNCDPDLRGKHFRFRPEEDAADGPVFRVGEHSGLQQRQIGPTGDMTAEGWVRAMPCPVDEFMRRSELGEPPPTPWKRRLYLEWHSQNGRVVIEMAGAVVEECVRESKDENLAEWAVIPNMAEHPESEAATPPRGPEFTTLERDGDDIHIERWRPVQRGCEDEDDCDASLPDELRRQLNAEAAAIDRAIGAGDDDDDEEALRELELIDYCMEQADERPVASLIKGVNNLPPAGDLDDVQVEAQLKAVLGQLAMIGVAVDLCEHFSPRDCYRLLQEKLLKDATAYEELIGTGWVTHISTYEYCPQCEAEIEKEIQSRE